MVLHGGSVTDKASRGVAVWLVNQILYTSPFTKHFWSEIKYSRYRKSWLRYSLTTCSVAYFISPEHTYQWSSIRIFYGIDSMNCHLGTRRTQSTLISIVILNFWQTKSTLISIIILNFWKTKSTLISIVILNFWQTNSYMWRIRSNLTSQELFQFFFTKKYRFQ